jgi:hypothetical protein
VTWSPAAHSSAQPVQSAHSVYRSTIAATDEIVAELPPLELDDLSAALRFAAVAVADREIPLQTTA